MWRQLIQSIALSVIVWSSATTILASSGQPASDSEQRVNVTRNLTSMPLAFTENQGQWDERALFRANAGGATMWFTTEGVVYHFTRRIPTDGADITLNELDGESSLNRHSCEGRNPDKVLLVNDPNWAPAFAGVTGGSQLAVGAENYSGRQSVYSRRIQQC